MTAESTHFPPPAPQHKTANRDRSDHLDNGGVQRQGGAGRNDTASDPRSVGGNTAESLIYPAKAAEEDGQYDNSGRTAESDPLFTFPGEKVLPAAPVSPSISTIIPFSWKHFSQPAFFLLTSLHFVRSFRLKRSLPVTFKTCETYHSFTIPLGLGSGCYLDEKALLLSLGSHRLPSLLAAFIILRSSSAAPVH